MIFPFIYHFLIFQLSHSKQSIPSLGCFFRWCAPTIHPMPLHAFSLILHSSFGISRGYPPFCVRKHGAAMMVLKQGGTETSSTAIRTREVLF